MFDLFRYAFMQRAFLLALALALAAASIGMVLVLRRLSQLGDALSHSSLAGVAVGLIFGFNPVLSAGVAALLAAFGIELLRRFFPKYSEVSIAIVFSAGIGLAGVLSGFAPSGNFSSFLFGSIVAVSEAEALAVTLASLAVFVLCRIWRRELCYISFDEEAARLSALSVRLLNNFFTLMTALTISLASRTVGALVVSSLLVLPVSTAMLLERNYKKTQRLAYLFSLVFTLAGLWLAFILNLKPGGTIVLLAVFVFLLVYLVHRLLGRARGPAAGEARRD